MQTQIDQRLRAQGVRGFKFEEAWLLWDDCERRVNEAWASRSGLGSTLSKIHENIVKCGANLQAWGAMKTHPDVEEIKRLQNPVEYLNMRETTEEGRAEFLEVSK